MLIIFLLLQIPAKADIMGNSERSDPMEWETSVWISGETRLLHIRYFVLPPQKNEELSLPCYGIGITDGEETYTVPFFSPDRQKALHTAQLLCLHRVTPVSFPEVMDDLLAEDTALSSPR